ncbi:MAG: phage holin family protein [Sulfuricaulis sp.]|uniref:phage holin family protein n=1 Tax=Sulfuricaulis sp. TaxID=2003553 RepID=UPI003C36FF93
MSESDTKAPAGGLLASLQRLLATLLDIMQTRVAIVATEFEEERVRLRELVVFGFVALFFVNLGIVLFTLLVVMLFWESHRLYVMGGFALLYLGVGVVAGISLRHRMKSRPRLFATTLAELSKDRDQLTPPSI